MNINLQIIDRLQKEYERLISLERYDEAQMVKSQLETEKNHSLNEDHVGQ